MSRSKRRIKNKLYDPLKQVKSLARATVGPIPQSQIIKDHKQRSNTKHKLCQADRLDPNRDQ